MGLGVSRVLAAAVATAVMTGSLHGVAQASPASAATGAQASAVTGVSAKKWSLTLRTADGKKLTTVRLKNGKRSPRLVVGDTYRASGTVPRLVRERLRGSTLRLQTRPSQGGAWSTVKKVRVAKNGHFDATFAVTRKLLHKRDYRVVASVKARSKGLAATTAAASPTTTATAVIQYVVVMNNNSGDNLVVTGPTAQTSAGNYTPSSFNLDNGQSATMVYTNPPPGNSLVWSVQKQNCFGPNCTTYRTSWNYTPTRSSTACSSASPQITSGSSYTVWLKPQFGSGYDGYLAGPLAGATAATTTCTFQLVEAFDNWIENNPVKAFAAIVVAVALIAIVVVATVGTDGADLVVADEVEEVYLDDGWQADPNEPFSVFDLIDPDYIPV